jgi:TetR/AcrR family transcriptional regulator
MGEPNTKLRARAAAKPRGRAAATKQRILDCALNVFAEHGFDGTTVRDVAADAGVNHAMIHYYYSNKEELWRAAVAHLFGRIDKEIDYSAEFLETLPTEAGFKEFVRRYVRYCARHPEHARLMVQESIRGGERLRWAVDEFIRPKHQLLAPATLALIEAGKLPDVSPMSLIYIIVAASQVPYMLQAEMEMVFGADLQSHQAVEAHADAVVAILFGERRGDAKAAPPLRDAPQWARRKPAKSAATPRRQST